ncbi:MAG: ATP-dependent helicase HrpB [Candidatus Kapabacteria bacterium]|nr:ATP-dependent helicase HrpB [Candidatus Kapabacteria bacterium]
MQLPIEAVLNDIRNVLSRNLPCILEAPPGAGKTTMVPLALVNEAWLEGKKIVMLEPRRLAAKAAARRMAALLGESVGQTVGYRMRLETAVSEKTRIEVVTEGVLTRQLARDPELTGVGLVIFDEFHERSLNADTGLALTLTSRALLRSDLRVMVMSATIGTLNFATIMPDAEHVSSQGRTFPVETTYLRSASDKPLHELVAAAVRDAIRDESGDILCFLPGQAEIRRTQEVLLGRPDSLDAAEVMILHGELAADAQDAVLRPASAVRRIILSTAIAETSITIDGVRTVIDAGRSREPRFDPRSGMTHLTTVSVSKDAAEQRKGRAGRTAPGRCIRLWTEKEHGQLPERRTSEILVADCSGLILEVASFGVDIMDLPWLEAPPAGNLAQGRELLRQLGALDASHAITPHGRELLRYGTHPRIAHMLVRSQELGIDWHRASGIAAIVGERDLLKGERLCDVRRRLDALQGAGDGHADRAAVAHARKRQQALRKPHSASAPTSAIVDDDVEGVLIALAYPERIARSKGDARFLLRNGRTATIMQADPLARHEWLAVADLDGSASEPRIAIAAPLSAATLRMVFADDLVEQVETGWNDRDGRIVARTATMLGAIVVETKANAKADAHELAKAFARELAKRGIENLPWSEGAERLRDRVAFTRQHTGAQLPDMSDEALSVTIEEWLAPLLVGMRSMADLQKLDLARPLREMLSREEKTLVDRSAPEFYKPPKGREVPIDYANPDQPLAAVRLQFMLGVKRTPTVANGNVPLTIELLSPADRPIQKTRDLAGFWSGSYQAVRKEMKGRYPKHDWPENP